MNKMSFQFPNGSLKYAEIQHSGMKHDRRIYSLRSMIEWEVIRDCFSQETKTVLDLGCGLGRMSVWANWQLGNGDTKYYLADRSELSENVKGGFPAKQEWYNDLDMTRQFAAENGLHNCETIDLVRPQALLDLARIDVLMSIGAVGYHWPLENSVDILEQLDCGVMIFTVRPGHYQRFPGKLRIFRRTPISLAQEDFIFVA